MFTKNANPLDPINQPNKAKIAPGQMDPLTGFRGTILYNKANVAAIATAEISQLNVFIRLKTANKSGKYILMIGKTREPKTGTIKNNDMDPPSKMVNRIAKALL